ncbi:MAG TPA: outer membrane lipoprotein-sorting protein [Vicinamibacterales bacterium]|nr:outer membrane lipoprotein-sorting protein [Vicinamibacterales bacterium]
MTRLAATVIAAMTLAATTAGQRDQVTARDVMEKNFFATKVSSLRVESTMVLINPRGQQRARRNTALIKLQANGIDSKFLLRFSTPADIKGTGVLQIEHSDGDDDLWIYLPALKKSRRLVANNKKDSFAGSDFAYGDIALPKVDSYRHTLLRSEKIDAFDCYVIESTPASDAIKANSGYGRKITWVRADNFVEAKVEYYDLAGRLLKTQITGRHQLIEPDKGRWFALYREMTNHQSGHRTTIDASSVEAVAVPDDMFTTRYLERE